ncbi:MAG: glycosyltransferase [bacterium]|nr:glycosyltransferase [bacterium]
MKKILLIGAEVTDFLNPLARKLKDIGYRVDLLELRAVPRNSPSITESYTSVLDYSKVSGMQIKLIQATKYLVKREFFQNLIKAIFINYLEGNYRIIKEIKNSLNYMHSREIFSSILNNYDIINFHSLNLGTLSFIKHVYRDKKIILSFWGSDLYQTSGLKNYYEQLGAVNKADKIAVLNYEMEKVVLSKFGSELKNKIVHTALGIEDEIFDLMDNYKKEKPDLNFLKKYNIPDNKIKITVGYCGNMVCNHLLILGELEKIESTLKDKIHLLVPMTYGNYTKEYMQEVVSGLERAKISYTIFKEYLSLDEVAKLRVNSDIMIQMNKSDGFNTSVREALYADNILISAVWLPYSLLRLENIFFYETDFKQLGETVTLVLNSFEQIKNRLFMNPVKAKKLTAFSQNFQPWISMFDSL